MKHIASFGYLPCLHLNLTDKAASVVVDAKNRTILLDEGPGDDRFNSAFFASEDGPYLEVAPIDAGGGDVFIHCQGFTHFLGRAVDLAAALAWCDAAHGIIGHGPVTRVALPRTAAPAIAG